MEKIIEFLRESRRKELEWKLLVRLVFSRHLSEKEKTRILETFTVAIITLIIATPIIVKAAPTLVTIVDQQCRTITNLLEVQAVGCTVKAYNSSHFVLEMEESCILKVYLYNITVFQGTLEPNGSYVIKASVLEMRITSPSRDIPITVMLVGSDKEWHLYGEKEYTLYPVPAATYNISLPGESFTIYYNGGELRVVKDFSASPQLPLLVLAVVPLASYGGYKAFKQKGSPLLAKYRLRKRRGKPKPRIKLKSKPLMKLKEDFKKHEVKHKLKPIGEEKKKEIVKVCLAGSGAGRTKKRKDEKPVSGFWAKLAGRGEKPSLKGSLKYRTLADLLEVIE